MPDEDTSDSTSIGRICDQVRSCRPKRPEFSVLMADSDFQQSCEAGLRPELASALKAVLELGALGFHGSTSDGQPQVGGEGIIHVVPVAFEVVVCVLDGKKGGRGLPWRVGEKLREGFEQFLGRMVFQGVEYLGTPLPRVLLVFEEEFGGKGVQVLAGVVEVEGSDRTLLEAVLEDIPQPYSAIHDDVDDAGFAKAHPACFVLDLLAEGYWVCLCGDCNDMLREQSTTLRADLGLILKPVDDRRLDLMPVNSFLPLGTLLFPPVFATMPRHPSVHHDDQHIFPSRLAGTSG